MDEKITRALIDQVNSAIPPWGNERDVKTFVSRPMWEAFLRFLKLPSGTEPTEWRIKDCVRVYGSETIVVDSDLMFSYSLVSYERLLKDWELSDL